MENETFLRLMSSFLKPKELGRLEQCCRVARSLTLEAWTNSASRLEGGAELGSNAKQAVKRFLVHRTFARRMHMEAEAHYAALRYVIEGEVNSNCQNCDLPTTLSVAECFEEPEEFNFFLLVMHGKDVLYEGFVSCCRTDVHCSSIEDHEDSPFWVSLRTDLGLSLPTQGRLRDLLTNGNAPLHDLFRGEGGQIGDHLRNEIENCMKPLRAVLTCESKAQSTGPGLVVATAMADDAVSFNPNGCIWWDMRGMPVVTHGHSLRLGDVGASFSSVNGYLASFIFTHGAGGAGWQ
jgi:hypothetical protein